MRRHFSQFEGNQSKKLEQKNNKEAGIEKLNRLSKEIANKYRTEGVPVNDDCRLIMENFLGFYSENEIKKDLTCVKNYEMEWYGANSEEEIKAKKSKTTGDKLERLKTIIFNKFLGSDFIVVRTSLYDDIKNSADNLIVDRQRGNPVCAFDEVGDISGERYQQKKNEILKKNICQKVYSKEKGSYIEKGGVTLKYGLKLEKNKVGNWKLSLSQIEEVPIFLIALPQKQIEEGVDKVDPSLERISDYEKKLFEYFIVSLEAQVKSVRLVEAQLSDKLKKSLLQFDSAIQKIRNKLNKENKN